MYPTLVTKNNYSSLDLLKFIMAIIVIAIHTHPFENYLNGRLADIYSTIIKIAVPIFFTISGFLFQKKLNSYTSLKKIEFYRNYCKNLIKTYLIWTGIYLPLTLYGLINEEGSIMHKFFLFFRGVFLKGENYYSWPLWYLLAMIFSMNILYFLFKKKTPYNLIFSISIIFYIISIFLSETNIGKFGFSDQAIKIVQISIGSGRILSSLVFVCLGIYFANNIILERKSINIGLFFIFAFINYLNINFISEFSLLVMVYSLFQIAIIYPIKVNQTTAFKMRKSSTILFYLHMYIIFFIQHLMHINDNLFVFILATIIGLLFSVFIIQYYKTSNALQLLF